MTPRATSLGLLAALVLGAAGCGGEQKKGGPSSVTVKGRLVQNGKPFTFDPNKSKLPPGTSAPPVAPGATGLQITFIPQSGGGQDLTFARIDPDTGAFETSLVPGRYKIALSPGGGAGGGDPFGGMFLSDRTKIVRDVKEGEEIVIDVARPAG